MEKLFDYIQIYLAVISKDGWNFLIEQYSYERLFEIMFCNLTEVRVLGEMIHEYFEHKEVFYRKKAVSESFCIAVYPDSFFIGNSFLSGGWQDDY